VEREKRRDEKGRIGLLLGRSGRRPGRRWTAAGPISILGGRRSKAYGAVLDRVASLAGGTSEPTGDDLPVVKLSHNGDEPLERALVVSRPAYGTDEDFGELDVHGSASSWTGVAAAELAR
jgi:hypothetical protein